MSDADVLFHLYSKFPSLVAQNRAFTKFSWLKKIGIISFMIEIKCPHFPKATDVEIVGDERFLFIRVLLSTLGPHIFYGLENLCVCYNYKHKYGV